MDDGLQLWLEVYEPGGDKLFETIGRLGSLPVAWQAYNAAVEHYGARYVVMLRRKAHVMARSDSGERALVGRR